MSVRKVRIRSWDVRISDADADGAAIFEEFLFGKRGGGIKETLLSNNITGAVRKITFNGKDYLLKNISGQKHRYSYLAKSFFRGSNVLRLMRASERSRAAGEHFMPTIYVAADRRIFGVSVESYLLTEFISGTDVGKMPNWRERYGDACARCIAACHRYGIVHGDVHPGNFMVENETERVYVVDIAGKKATGISKAIDRMKCEKWFGIKNEIKDPGFRMAQFRIGWRAFRRRIFGKKD